MTGIWDLGLDTVIMVRVRASGIGDREGEQSAMTGRGGSQPMYLSTGSDPYI